MDHIEKGLEKFEETQRQLEEMELVNDFSHVLSTKQGKRFIITLLQWCDALSDGMPKNDEPDRKTYFLAGKRNIGLRLYDLILKSNRDALADLMRLQSNIQEVKHATRTAELKRLESEPDIPADPEW